MSTLTGDPRADRGVEDLSQLLKTQPQEVLNFILAIHCLVSMGLSVKASIERYLKTLTSIAIDAPSFAACLTTNRQFVESLYDRIIATSTTPARS